MKGKKEKKKKKERIHLVEVCQSMDMNKKSPIQMPKATAEVSDKAFANRTVSMADSSL